MINSVSNISSSVVRVTWTRPTTLNGVLTSYTIKYVDVITSNTGSIIVDFNAEEVGMYNYCMSFAV